MFDPRRVQQHSLVEIDCEIFSTAITVFSMAILYRAILGGSVGCTYDW